MADACGRAIQRGRSRVRDALSELDYVEVSRTELADVTDLRTFENVNSREELEAAEASLSDVS
jgi:molybdopterin-guanine dinucleotide biosynthesis protein A